MKVENKKRLFAIFIILTFALSTIAFVIVGITGRSNFFGNQQQQFKPLEGYVIDGDIDATTEANYVNRGYTFLKFYYNETPPAFIDLLPESLLAENQPQLFVIKIKDQRNYARIINFNTYKEITNLTEDNVIDELCNSLIVIPLECGLRNI